VADFWSARPCGLNPSPRRGDARATCSRRSKKEASILIADEADGHRSRRRSTGPRFRRLCDPTRRAAGRITRRFWRAARSMSRRIRGPASRPARSCKPGQMVIIDRRRQTNWSSIRGEEQLAKVEQMSEGPPDMLMRPSEAEPRRPARNRRRFVLMPARRPTSNSRTIWPNGPPTPGPKGSGCIDPNFCSPAGRGSPERGAPVSTKSIAGRCSRGWPPSVGHGSEHFDVDEDPARDALRGSGARRQAGSADEERRSRQGLRGLRLSLTRPEALSSPAARVASRLPARIAAASCFRSCPEWSSCGKARRMVTGGRRRDLTAGGHHIGSGADRRDGSEIPAAAYTGRTCWPREVDFLHDRDQRSHSGTAWPSIVAPMNGSPDCTNRCIRRS